MALRERYVRWGVGLAGFAVVAVVWHFGAKRSGGIVPVSERRVMPQLVMAQMGGGTWRMAEHHGQVVLVNYWASWCGPCWEETPGLVRLSKEMGPGLAVVGVAIDEGSREKVKSFVDTLRVPYPVVFAEGTSQMAYGMAGVPETILVDRRGRVAKTYVGAVGEGDLREDIGVLLAEGR
jgi:cytochrome c biogenesis protein CcmG/thiol:disulfide interchange protein DsbE